MELWTRVVYKMVEVDRVFKVVETMVEVSNTGEDHILISIQ
jgi:hypothetical protein